MKKTAFPLASVLLITGIIAAQVPKSADNTPREVVKRLWSIAARGELLSPEGWKWASAIFSEPSPPPDYHVILIRSDLYGVNQDSVDGTQAEVDMEFTDMGQIDSKLRYTAPPQRMAYKTSLRYHLVASPGRIVRYVPDPKGKLQKQTEEEIPEIVVWHIKGPQGPPWTTVNGTIRYVLEQRNRAADPAMKKNADATLTELLKLH